MNGESNPGSYQTEGINGLIPNLLREALNQGDKAKTREMVDYIKRMVERGSKTTCSPMTDLQLDELIKTGNGEIDVGTGTSGQRIFIEGDKLWMPYSSGVDEEYGRQYHNNFRHLFYIPEDQELVVKF